MVKKSDLIVQLLANTIPLIGFWFFNWSMFAIIYLYWAEGFIAAFYSCAKIAIAHGPETPEYRNRSFFTRLLSSFKFFIFRVGILLFYFIFIFAFVAYPDGATKEIVMQNYTIMWLKDSWFNNALLIYFLTQMVIFISNFIASDDYKNKPSSSYKILFGGRTIVLHIVIVLGTFGYQFFRRYETINDKLPALSYVLLLVIIKSISDLIEYKLSGRKVL